MITKSVILLLSLFATALFAAEPAKPNVILILADDLGFSDLGCFGAKDIRTPNLDRMAEQGTRFTGFHVAQAVCTASRAALMSGCYPNRIGMHGALNHTSRVGIHPDEWLLPQMFKERGYATTCIGKWHLGTLEKFSPLHYGFVDRFGTPYSNDNSKYHPVFAAQMPPFPLYDGNKVIELDPDQSQFTRRFTERAVSFIETNKDRPFFLYLPHVMPHVPIFASEKFKGRSKRGLYGDVVEELDWSVGEILSTLDRLDLAKNTIVIFFSDNGPWLSYGDHAGSAVPLREGKLTAFDGGMRSPLIVRWPGKVPAGRVSDDPWMAIDWLPTLTELAGGKLPTLKIDGLSATALVLGEPGAKPPHEALFFYAGDELHAVRSGDWKLHFPHPFLTTAGEPGHGGKPSNWGKATPFSIQDSSMNAIASRHGQRVEQLPLSLFNARTDPGETLNVAADHPEIVERLSKLAEPIRADIGDALTRIKGSGVRLAGREPDAVVGDALKRKTSVKIVDEDFHINGQPTYAGRSWNGKRIEGLLLNARMVQATFDDLNSETAKRWAYADTGKWDAERNVREFIAAMPEWKAHGLLAITVNMQGGSPEGYSKQQPWETGAYTPDGALRPEFADRMRRVLDAADEQGMVVILGYFYFGQSPHFEDDAAVIRAADETTQWLLAWRWTNVLVEINNESNPNYKPPILQPDRVSLLIDRVRKTKADDGHRLLVGTSFGGRVVPSASVIAVSDFVLIHGNGAKDPEQIRDLIHKTRSVSTFKPIPVLINEDDHENFEHPVNNFSVSISEHVSWGWFDYRRKSEAMEEGYQSPPVNWGITSSRKRGFFNYLA
jgi:arylsulfatase A-like enzyme